MRINVFANPLASQLHSRPKDLEAKAFDGRLNALSPETPRHLSRGWRHWAEMSEVGTEAGGGSGGGDGDEDGDEDAALKLFWSNESSFVTQ